MENFRTDKKCNWVNNELIVARRNRMARIGFEQARMGKYPWCINTCDMTFSLPDISSIYNQIGEIVYVPRELTKNHSISLDEAINRAKPNMDKIKDVDKHLDSIR